MRFNVIWTPVAEQKLGAIWMNAQDRNALTTAASTIDALLRSDPASQGESRLDTVRVMFAPPLGAEFEVNEEDRIVYVLGVWPIGKR